MTLMAASKDHEIWLQNNKSRVTEMHANLCSITTLALLKRKFGAVKTEENKI